MSQKGLAVAALGRDRYGEVNYIGKTQGCHGPVAVSTGDRYGEVTAKAGSTVTTLVFNEENIICFLVTAF